MEVQFRWPNRLTPAQAKWADFQAVVKTVEIAPGAVPSIAAQDCRLVRRINTELLQPLGVNIVKAAFDCEAQHPTFDLVVKVDEALLKRQAVNKGVANTVSQWKSAGPDGRATFARIALLHPRPRPAGYSPRLPANQPLEAASVNCNFPWLSETYPC